MTNRHQGNETSSSSTWSWKWFFIFFLLSFGSAAILAGLMYFIAPLINPNYPQNLKNESTLQILALGALATPIMYAGFAIKEMLWNELSSKVQTSVIVGLVIIGLFLYIFALPSDNRAGQGVIDVYPIYPSEGEERGMAVEMEVKDGWWHRKEYYISELEWEDRDNTYVNCTINETNNICTNSEEGSWKIEIVDIPEPIDNSTD